MTLIYHARSTLDLAKTTNDGLVRCYAVAVRFERVGRLGQRVAERSKKARRQTTVGDLSLQSVVIADAQVHYCVDLTDSARHRQNGTRGVCCRNGPDLSRRGAIKYRRRIQIDGAIELGPVLMHVVRARDQPPHYLVLRADRNDLAPWIHKLIRIIRQLVEVQPKLRELGLVERALARDDRDVTRRKLRRRERLRIKHQRQTRSGQAGGEAELAGNCSVGRQSVQSVYQVAGNLIGSNLRVIHRVAAADRQPRLSTRMPTEPDARRKVLRRVGQRLSVITESRFKGEVGA